ncbi:MAG: SpoIIE family protein phosphatase [Bacteroidetes bacterium]|nr:SpoIIE family protein phosphatase [Bacteroidota bacterium]
MDKISKKIKKNTLIISDNCPSDEYIMINFIDNDPERKFELNIKNILFADLEISKKIVTLGGGQDANWKDLFIKVDKQLDEAQTKLKEAHIKLAEQTEEISKQQAVIDEKTRILSEQELKISKQQDSLMEQESEMKKRENILLMQNMGINEQKEKMKEQQAVLDRQMSELKKQRMILYLFSALLLVILSLAYFIYRSYKIKKKANILLKEKNEEILRRNEEIESQRDQIMAQRDQLIEKNEEIMQQKEEIQAQAENLEEVNRKLARTNEILTSSINYAKKIQDAILPSDELINRLLPDSFVFFRPRDIVSGDFYWLAEKNDTVYVAAVDCTGHGVPGAFMSMIGNTLLNGILGEKGMSSPASILDSMNKRIIASLNQGKTGEDSQDDGMDITLCAIPKQDSAIRIACANHFAYLVNDKGLHIIEGDILSIGDPLAKLKGIKYTDHKVEVGKGSVLYIFSDGFQDQFGGDDNSKFMSGRLQKLLVEHRNMSMEEQKALLEKTFDQWKGEERQLDDVLIIGIRF